ncbi:single-stranded-DNA-specific exonuclease RecJ [Paenibacillus marinisediminis]
MLQARTRWRCAEVSEAHAQQLAQETGTSPLLAKLLLVRGIENAEHARHFLYDSLDQMLDPFDLAGMTEAVARIRKALQTEERLWIYGDYDADGVSSTSLMIYLMRQLGANFDYYIPHRALEGYGLNHAAIDRAKADGVTLIITVDTGISAVDQIAYAKQLGIDVVVTDHHEPPDVLPEAFALVNPKLPYCTYSFKGLAGVGVAFKLAHALLGQVPEHLLELAAIGTVADLMPLTSENRIIVSEALKRMRKSQYPGIKALLQVSGVDMGQVTSTNIAFSMAPRINASGRLDHADTAVQLLTTDDEGAALACAEELDRLNKERQKIVELIVKEAEELIADKLDENGKPPHVIVLAKAGWNVGVIGIVASKIVERYYRPTFILGIDEETGLCKGSARSIEGLDLYEAMTECSELFDHYGGHSAAAGMTIAADRLDDLERALNQIAHRELSQDHLIPSTEVDVECTLQDIPLKVIDELSKLEPFGMGNSSPRVIIRDVIVDEKRTMGKENQHLKLSLTQERATLDAVAFNKGMLADRIASAAVADVLGELQVNEWNGRRKPQMMLQDIRIRAFQVLDRRGASEPTAKAVELARKLNGDRPNEAVWVASRTNAGVFAAEPYVKVNEDSLDECEPMMSVRDVILTEAPNDLEAVKWLQSMYPQMERLHLILPRELHNGRLSQPDRKRIIPAYAEMKKLRSWTDDELSPRALSVRIGFSLRETELLLRMFEDLNFMTVSTEGSVHTYQMVESPQKTSLDASPTFQQWQEASEWEACWYSADALDIAKMFN